MRVLWIIFFGLWAPDLLADFTATDASGLGLSSMSSMFTPPPTDVSVAFLGQLFGSVGGVLPGVTGQLLGQLFKALNYGMVLIAGAVVTYTVIMSVVNTAQDGQFMGQQKNTAWTIVRTVGGISVLIPKASGYSFIQVFIMWAVVQGIGLADTLWSSALTYLETHSLTQTPDTSKTTGVPVVVNNGVKLLQSAICIVGLKQITADAMRTNHNVPSFEWGAHYNTGNNKVEFGSSTQSSYSDVCGSVDFDQLGLSSTTGLATLQVAGSELASSFLTLGLLYLDAYPSGSTPTTGQGATVRSAAATGIVSSAINFVTNMMPALQEANSSCHTAANNNTYGTAHQQGWIVAGAYYFNLSQATNKCTVSLTAAKLPTPTGPNLGGQISSLTTIFGGTSQTALNYLNDTLIPMPADQNDSGSSSEGSVCGSTSSLNKATKGICIANIATTTWTNIHKSMEAESNAAAGNHQYQLGHEMSAITGAAAGVGIAAFLGSGPIGGVVVSTILGQVVAVLHDFEGVFSNSNTPLLDVASLGNSMINHAVTIWIVCTSLVFVLAAAMSIMNSMTGIGSGVISSSMSMMPVMTSVVVALIVNGIMLAVYTPLIPFLIYFFTSIGWMMSVVEAMVAGPLVALGVTHPEGHDLLGKSEQSLMLLLSVFMKPVVMVIAFFVSMILARVAVQLLNIGFAVVIKSISTNGLNGIPQALGLVFVYTMSLIRVVSMCFSVIYLMPDRIMRWIGVSPDSIDVESHLRMIKSGLQQASQQGAETTFKMGAGDKSTVEWGANLGIGKSGKGGATAEKK